MLGRRNLRIKVMQTLYGWELDHDIPLTKLEGQLKSQVHKSLVLYLTDLLYLVEVCRFSMTDKIRRQAKYIKTEDDEKASTTIASNRIIKFLETDKQVLDFTKKEGVHNYVNEEVLKSLYAEICSKTKYKEYAVLEQPTIEQDKDIINFILKKVFQNNKDLEHHLQETFVNYDDDDSLILHIISKYVDSFQPEGKNSFFQNMDVWDEELQFAVNLLAKTIEQSEELIKYIQPKLKNWEMDRIAILDLILLKLAVCELKYFPTIPVKVSINEYIDISKLYSTPKSKDFVNGVLDKVKNEMMDKGEIKKYGRGLVE